MILLIILVGMPITFLFGYLSNRYIFADDEKLPFFIAVIFSCTSWFGFICILFGIIISLVNKGIKRISNNFNWENWYEGNK